MADRTPYPCAWPTLAWRHYEEALGAPLRDAAIEAAALAAGPALERRIIVRATGFARQRGFEAGFARHRRLQRRAALLALGAGAFAGVAAARLIPEGVAPRANLLDMLGALLLPNLLALGTWLLLQLFAMVRGQGATGSWLGSALQHLVERVAGVGRKRDDVSRAVQRGLVEYYAETAAGRARLSLLSQLFWLALAAGAMLGCWWLLSLRQVDFYWGSTLLGADAMTRLLDWLAAPVGWLGFPVPATADVAASRVDVVAMDAALRARWGWFLLGALAAFGLLPRVAAVAACVAIVAAGDRRFRPNLALPGYWRLQSLLAPAAATARVIDPDTAEQPRADLAPAVATEEAPPAAAAWIALERALPVPPGAVDLGTSLERADQQRLLQAVAAGPSWPALVIHAPLAATPDRGLAHFVATLVAAADRPVYLRVADGVHEALSPQEAEARREDWRRLALTAGIPPVRVSSARA